MPYINSHKRRQELEEGARPEDAGELTYILYKKALDFLNAGKGIRFLRLATIFGCLLCVILELYRRKAAPYEDLKIKENGDVF